MRSLSALALISLTLSTQSFAKDPSTGKFTILSMGTKSCGDVVAEFKADDQRKLNNSIWVAGYLTAINERNAKTSNIASGTDPAAWDLWINNYCAANPLSTLSEATTALVEELSKRRHTLEAPHPEPIPTSPDDVLPEPGGMLGCVEGDTLDLGPLYAGVGGVTNPELIISSKVEPTYPKIARKGKVYGQVILQVVVCRDGAVGDIQVLRTPGSKFGFDEAAIAAVKQWRYKPALNKGKPVDVFFTVAVDFVLQQKSD